MGIAAGRIHTAHIRQEIPQSTHSSEDSVKYTLIFKLTAGRIFREHDRHEIGIEDQRVLEANTAAHHDTQAHPDSGSLAG